MNTANTTTSTPVMPPKDREAWHQGEIEMQERVGVRQQMADVGKRVLRDHLIDQHRQFYPQLPFAVFGTVDENDDVWATLRANHPGFLSASDPYHLSVNLPRDADDPADASNCIRVAATG